MNRPLTPVERIELRRQQLSHDREWWSGFSAGLFVAFGVTILGLFAIVVVESFRT